MEKEVSAKAYEDLYRRAYARTCSVFHKKGFSPQDCEDLAQEVFLEIWRDAKARDRALHLLPLWQLKVGLILQRASLGRYSSPMDTLIAIRNVDEYPALLGTTEPLDKQEMAVYSDFLSKLPVPLAREVSLLLQGFTYAERRRILKIHPSSYIKLREQLMNDPSIQQYIQTYLRG